MNIFQLFILQNLVNVSYFEILLKHLLWVVIGKADRLLASRNGRYTIVFITNCNLSVRRNTYFALKGY